MSKKTILNIAIWVAVSLLIGFLSSFATASGLSDWYTTINKPSFNPPNWIFAPVWTSLYIMMGIGTGLVASSDASIKRSAVLLFVIHLLVNAFWSVAFFSLHQPLLALVMILILLVMIAMLIKKYHSIKAIAGYLLVPYFLWVSFATLLNASIVWLN